MKKYFWVPGLAALALLAAVLEGVLASPPTWFVQFCGVVTLICPTVIVATALMATRKAGDVKELANASG